MSVNHADNPTSLPFPAAADLWNELTDAYLERHAFGSTAEIYGFRLRGASALVDANETLDNTAGLNLHGLVSSFRERHPCEVNVDGKEFGEWVKDLEIAHRTKVQLVATKS